MENMLAQSNKAAKQRVATGFEITKFTLDKIEQHLLVITANTKDKNISLDSNLVIGGKTGSQATDVSLATTLPKKKAWVKPKQIP
jgi:hypothetical protein